MKDDHFKTGDKVFAKLKGYPPWPAIILEEIGKKYNVRFYGTGEIGQIRVDDIWYYSKNKEKLLKPLKRKDFQVSIAEIESAIRAAGTDGDPNPSNDDDNTPTKKVSKTKRKKSVDVSVSDTKRSRLSESEDRELNNIEYVNQDESVIETKPEDLLFKQEAEVYIEYGKYVETLKEKYQKMSIEHRHDSPSILIPFVKENKIVGVKIYNSWPLPTFENEYERAIYDKELLETALQLEEPIKSDSHIPLEIEEEDLKELYNKRINNVKDEMSRQLQVEATLIRNDKGIKESLRLEQADPEKAIELLNEIVDLNVSALMLKKHPYVVDMIKRLRRYIGNLENWNLGEEETENFIKKAEIIRDIASQIYDKFIDAFKGELQRETFWDDFTDHIESFLKNTEDLSEMEYYMLTDEPYSRKNFYNSHIVKDLKLDLIIESDIDSN